MRARQGLRDRLKCANQSRAPGQRHGRSVRAVVALLAIISALDACGGEAPAGAAAASPSESPTSRDVPEDLNRRNLNGARIAGDGQTVTLTGETLHKEPTVTQPANSRVWQALTSLHTEDQPRLLPRDLRVDDWDSDALVGRFEAIGAEVVQDGMMRTPGAHGQPEQWRSSVRARFPNGDDVDASLISSVDQFEDGGSTLQGTYGFGVLGARRGVFVTVHQERTHRTVAAELGLLEPPVLATDLVLVAARFEAAQWTLLRCAQENFSVRCLATSEDKVASIEVYGELMDEPARVHFDSSLWISDSEHSLQLKVYDPTPSKALLKRLLKRRITP